MYAFYALVLFGIVWSETIKRGQIEESLSRTNTWWRARTGRPWEADDRDLRATSDAPFVYKPRPLDDLVSGGLYALIGPRRIGKSVEIKRAVVNLLQQGIEPRRVVHAACDGWRRHDLMTLLDVAGSMAPPGDGPRFFFINEITAITEDWVSQLKWMRDNTPLRDDCVVISGSSSNRLDAARAQLAGRRGPAQQPDRVLLPMGFRAFCQANKLALPPVPHFHPSDLLSRQATEATNELRPLLHELVMMWERYLEVGGFPSAVSGWASNREIPRKLSTNAPNFTQLTEQQIGVSLLRSLEYENHGLLQDHDELLFQRTASRSEIDFTGNFLAELPYEVKYTEGRWKRDAATMRAAYGRGIFATRNIVDKEDNILALPAAFIAVLLDPTTAEV